MSNGTTANSTPPARASSREKALTTVEDLGDNPLAMLAGGIALGVLVGMLIPRIARERELLDPMGRKLAERATAAASAAKEVGKQEIESLLPSKDDTKDRVSALFGNIVEAARDAAKA